jgi:ferrous iron transport protein B
MAVLESPRRSSPASKPTVTRRIALAGNPNAGKTTLFNALTGLKQHVGNYPGVTVEKKEGRLSLHGGEALLLDLPGTYSLSPKSPDEAIARDVLLGLHGDLLPDAVVIVVDASNLERNLFLATQILELGLPSVIALNMTDVAKTHGKAVDAALLSRELGVPVVECVAVREIGLDKLRSVLDSVIEDQTQPRPPVLPLPDHVQQAQALLAGALKANGFEKQAAQGIALRLLCSNVPLTAVQNRFGGEVTQQLIALREEGASGPHCLSPAASHVFEAQARYTLLSRIERASVQRSPVEKSARFTDLVDLVLTHRFWGLVVFGLLSLLVFQAIYSWSEWPMTQIETFQAWVSELVKAHMAEGPLRDLLVKGVIAGVGAVVIFLPQIMILFFFIGVLEDSGYMARAAFVMDRLMAKVGLPGRAFIPLMSSFACAIPGVMATRTIASRRDRMTTMMIAPLMSCSARLPVYMLMLGTFVPDRNLLSLPRLGVPLLGTWQPGLSLRAAAMFGLYVLGVVGAMGVSWLFKRTIFQGPPPIFLIELPDYKMPAWRNVIFTMWQRGSQFLTRAGTVILAISIVLWFLLNYPKPPNETINARAYSFAGRAGKMVEPLIEPIGFNWKVGIGLIGALSAREVFVATMGQVYNVGDEEDETSEPLRQAMKKEKWPDGRPIWSLPAVLSLLVYFVFAMQCISTLAIVRRETESWQWPLFMLFYMTGLAWILSFIVYQTGTALGWE